MTVAFGGAGTRLGCLNPDRFSMSWSPFSSELFRRSLQVAVDRRVDAEAALVDTLPAETLDELAPHLFLEVEAEGLLDFEGVVDLDRRRLRLFGGRRINRARAHHRLQHDVAARYRSIGVDRGRIARRRLDEAREQRRLRNVELGRRLAEIAARRRFDTVQAVAEVHLVEVHLENLLLRVQVLEIRRDDDLLHLARVGLAAGQEGQPRELLRDRAAALRPASRLQVLDDGAADADGVDAAVIEEALILDRNNGVDEVLARPWRGELRCAAL